MFPYQFIIMLKDTYHLLTVVLSQLDIPSAVLLYIESCGLKPLSLYTYHNGSADAIEITSGHRCCLWTRHHDFNVFYSDTIIYLNEEFPFIA